MKELFIIEDTLANKISYYFLVAFLIVLPFDHFYSEIVMVGFTLHTIIHLRKENIKNIFSKEVILFVALFAVAAISILYSQDKAKGWKESEKQLAMILLPLLLAVTSLDLKKYRNNLLLVFALNCIAIILYLYYNAVHIIAYNHLPLKTLFSSSFLSHDFCLPIGINATYLSMYITLSMVMIGCMAVKTTNNSKAFLYAIMLVILIAGLVQLSSRAVSIATAIIFITAFPMMMLQGKKRIQFIAAAVFLVLIFGIGITELNSFKERYLTELKEDLTKVEIDNRMAEPRVVRWAVAWELIKGSPVIGYGNGSEKKVLKEQYYQKKMYHSFLFELDAHSQYFSYWLIAGLPGILLYLFILFYGCRNAIQHKDIHFMAFLLLIMTVSVSENVLEMHRGILFFAFFFPLFLIVNRNYDTEKAT